MCEICKLTYLCWGSNLLVTRQILYQCKIYIRICSEKNQKNFQNLNFKKPKNLKLIKKNNVKKFWKKIGQQKKFFFSYFSFSLPSNFSLGNPRILKKHLQKMATSTTSWKAGKSEFLGRDVTLVTSLLFQTLLLQLWTLIPLPLIYVTLLKNRF